MADGEACERLWSFLRHFARTTKEMRPSHGINVLSDALSYYYSCLCSIRLGQIYYSASKRKPTGAVTSISIVQLFPFPFLHANQIVLF